MKVKTEQHHVKLADVIDEIAEEPEDKRIDEARAKAGERIPDSSPFKKLLATFTEDGKPILKSTEKRNLNRGK
jgi:hypothetical protein